jgi:hypothetical protein
MDLSAGGRPYREYGTQYSIRALNALALAFDHIAVAISEADLDDPDGSAANGVAQAAGLLILTGASKRRSRHDSKV